MSLPLTGDETTLLRALLQHGRDTLVRQVGGLDADQLGQSLAPSSLTLGGLMSHLAWVEDHWFSTVLAGDQPDEIWRDVDWKRDPDHDFGRWRAWTPAELVARFETACDVADAHLLAALATGGLDQTCARQRHGRDVSLRWVLIHMVEEYSRHNGHADLIRESIDGKVAL